MSFAKKIQIGNKIITENSPVFVIAEAGVNHGGDVNLAMKFIDIASEAGADAIKFQAFRTENVILPDVEKAPYQKETTEKKESQYEMIRKLEMTKENYKTLKEYCKQKGIIFLITPFDEGSLLELEEIGVNAYKVASTDTTNLPFLKKIAQTGKPIIFSTGMSYMNEVELALREMEVYNSQIILLQCTANYPIKDEEANLNVITTYKEKFNILTGYSDHSIGLGASLYAIPMGACMVEKHFTIDKHAKGPDHLASLNPSELKDFVKEVRRVETFLGSFIKEPTDSEKKTRAFLQKYLVAAKPIKKGELFTEENIVAKRTGGKGISPILYKEILGLPAKQDLNKNDIISIK